VTPFEFCDEIWRQKIRTVELPGGEEIIHRFDTIPVLGGRTDGRTRSCRKDPR